MPSAAKRKNVGRKIATLLVAIALALPLALRGGWGRRRFTGADCAALARLPGLGHLARVLHHHAQLTPHEAVFFAVAAALRRFWRRKVDIAVISDSARELDAIAAMPGLCIVISPHYPLLADLLLFAGRFPQRRITVIANDAATISAMMVHYGPVFRDNPARMAQVSFILADHVCLVHLRRRLDQPLIVLCNADYESAGQPHCDTISPAMFRFAHATGVPHFASDRTLTADGRIAVRLRRLDERGDASAAAAAFVAHQAPTRRYRVGPSTRL